MIRAINPPARKSTKSSKSILDSFSIPISYQIKIKMSRLFIHLTYILKGLYYRYSIAHKRGGSNLQWGLSSLLCFSEDVLQNFAFGASQIKLAPYIRQTCPLLETSVEMTDTRRYKAQMQKLGKRVAHSRPVNHLCRIFSVFTLFLKTKESGAQAKHDRLWLRGKINEITNWRNIIDLFNPSPTTKEKWGYSVP